MREEKIVVTPKQRRWLRILTRIVVSIVAFVVLLLAGVSWYATTGDFQRRANKELVSVLGDATGGRVEVGHVSLNPWHLAIEVDQLVIHGTEAAGETPYLSVQKILLRLHINMVLTHIRGLGPQSRISLRYLRVEQPHFHLIVAKNGSTNAPTPKHKSTSTTPIQDTLLDLQARKVELVDGIAVLNDRAIPFDMAANDLNAQVKWVRSSDRYVASLQLDNLTTKMESYPDVQSKLQLTAELGRDMASLDSFRFTTGAAKDKTVVTANASLEHFASPQWQASVKGSIDVKQLSYLAGVDGLDAGRLELDLNGHNCTVTPVTAQKNPRFWQHHTKVPAAAKILLPDPTCEKGYLMIGSVKMHNVGYRNEYVRFRDINGGASLHITPTELLLTALTGTLPGGGGAKGELKIENWLGEDADAKVQPSRAFLTATVDHIPLRTIMDTTGPPDYGDLGFDMAITGPTTVEWGGPAKEISDTVQVQSDLTFTPTGTIRKGALDNLPVTGGVLAHYDGLTETVKIAHFNMMTPASTLTASGLLGVDDGDPLTRLQVTAQSHDLAEFDQLLTTLDFESNGKKGAAALPIVLHGTMNFVGTARNTIEDLDVKGHLTMNDVAVHLGSLADVHIDSVVSDAEYAPNEGFAVGSSTITRGTAVMNVAGTFRPHKVIKHHIAEYDWDEGTVFDTTIKLANAQVGDLLQIAGQQQKIPMTGTANLGGHFAGTVQNLNGSGQATLTNGVAYGEAYQTISASFAAKGQEFSATNVLLQAHGMSVTGSGGYDLVSKHIVANLSGNNLLLSKFDTFRKTVPNDDGLLSFSVDANGTLTEPNLHAKLALANVMMDGKAVGNVNATAQSAGSNVSYEAHSTLVGAQVSVTGETSLLGDYPTKAKMTMTGLDLGNALALFQPESGFKGSSNIGVTVTVDGPAAKPELLAGTAEFTDFDVKLQGVELKSAAPLRASLKNGTVTVDAMHITGEDTDMKAAGTIGIFGDTNAQGGKLNMNADGSISMALLHTFDQDIISSGKVTFKVVATGRAKKPSLTGDVLFQNVNLAIDGIPNGLSNLNGTLAFNEDRLDVKDLTAQTGGGQLKIGGSVSYQKGIFADLTATGDTVRVRYAGLSATANASFRMQGGPQSVLLSGNVLVTRFGVGADVDFAAFSGGGGVQAPPDPNSATNKIRLDVRVTSAPQLDFQNSYAKLAGTINLNVRGTVAQPSILGRIQITDGSATFAGTKYELQRGDIYFSNPVRIDPTIDLDATARVENYDVTVGIHGTTTNIKPTYRSEPPLTEADIFNLLALGRTQEEAQLYQEQQVQSGADPTTSALLGGALNATVSSRVGKLFGAGSVKIDPAFVGTLGNSSARITVTEPLSKQLVAVFATNVNETEETLIQLQYQLSEDKSIVATRDESGVYSLVYKIRKRYR
jgi:translocation and assembly module TamB